MSDAEDILDFWFGELDELGCASPNQRKLWWTKSDAFDQTIRAKFLAEYESVATGDRERWRSTPRGALGYIIVLDQFSRNMFRNTAQMFDADPLAREVCCEGLDEEFDQELGFDERVFFYLPLEHSEEIADQERCLEVFQSLSATRRNHSKPTRSTTWTSPSVTTRSSTASAASHTATRFSGACRRMKRSSF